MGVATEDELSAIREMAYKVNDVLKEFFAGIGVKLVDFKIEAGRLPDGTIILADEISPDTCRFWDAKRRTRNSTRTDSAGTWAESRKPTRKCSGA